MPGVTGVLAGGAYILDEEIVVAGLYIVTPYGAWGSVTLDGPAMLLGRSDECEVWLRDENVSRRHLRISQHGEAFFVEDLGSKNGTYLNGVRLTRPVRLGDRDVIHAGRCVLTFVTELAAHSATVRHRLPDATPVPS